MCPLGLHRSDCRGHRGLATLRQFGFVTTLKAEAVLTCADAPAHGPQRWATGAPIELSEWVRWGNLRPELVRDLLWPPLTEKVVLSSFRHNGGLDRFMRVAPRIVLNDPPLPRPPTLASRHFLFWRSGN